MMKYKKIILSLSLCSSLLLVACQKNDQKVSASETQKAQKSENNHLEHKQSEHDLMLEAIRKNKIKLTDGACKIEPIGESDGIIVGDVNHDGKNDFLYGYMKFFDCDSQVPAFEYAVFLANKTEPFKLNNVFNAGMFDHIDVVEFEKIENNVIYGRQAKLDKNVKYRFEKNKLNEIEDPNEKILIKLGKAVNGNDSPFAAELDRMSYVPNEVECGGFFPDDQPEKGTTIDHYDLHISNDQMVVMGVFGLTAKDQVQVLGKTVTSKTTLNQVKQLFKTGYSLDERKNSTETIGAASEDAAKLKYDVMLSINTKDMDDAYLFYFKNNQLIAVQYFIPC